MQEKTQLIRNLKFIFILLSFALIFGCSKEISQTSAVVRNGLIYRNGFNEPFSGYVVGKGKSDFTGPRLAYRKQYKNGKLDGKTKYWYKNGQLESAIPYENGKINGVVTKYYENGQVKARVHLVNGKRGGSKGEMFWYADGRRQ